MLGAMQLAVFDGKSNLAKLPVSTVCEYIFHKQRNLFQDTTVLSKEFFLFFNYVVIQNTVALPFQMFIIKGTVKIITGVCRIKDSSLNFL